MKIKNSLLLIFLLCFYNTFSQNNKEERFKALKDIANSADLIFEAEFVKQDSSFKTEGKVIYTPFTLKITTMVSGNYSSPTINVIFLGGIVGNESAELSHGYRNPFSGKTVYFCNKEEITKLNAGNKVERFYTVGYRAPYAGDTKISGRVSFDSYYDNADEFYADLAKIKSIKVPKKYNSKLK